MSIHWFNDTPEISGNLIGLDYNNTTDLTVLNSPNVNLWTNEFCPIFAASAFISYLIYFGIGGFLHVNYYVNQRDIPEKWKCQPHKWLPTTIEKRAILIGSFNIFLGSILSSVIAWHILYGRKFVSKIYFEISEFGWLWLVFQTPVVFVIVDYFIYWHHRFYHISWMYKRFHKIHHVFKQPTAFAVTAFHPIEFISMQLVYIAPLFIVPTYWYNALAMYVFIYVNGILDHSGIQLDRKWCQPWQPDGSFHDDHHRLTKVNYGVCFKWWDTLHGTARMGTLK